MFNRSKNLIMLDVDQTLLDASYRSTSPTIVSVISQMQKEGHVFLLNSNRSLEDLLPVAHKFGITGELIGENGSFVYDQTADERQVLVDKAVITQIAETKAYLLAAIKKAFPHSRQLVDDSTQLNANPELLLSPDTPDLLFLVNQYRQFTVSIHAKKFVDGRFIKDLDSVMVLTRLASEYLAQKDFVLRAYPASHHGNLLVVPTTVDKGTGFSFIKKRYSAYTKVMIGDDCNDKPLLNEVDYFFAVGNAEKEVKEVADYVAKEKITKGAEEILLKLDELIK